MDYFVPIASIVIATLALLVSLRANALARRSKSDSDRVLLSEKKRNLIQEIDKQHVTILRLRFVLQDELLQFEICPAIADVQPDERERVQNNANALDKLEQLCQGSRAKAELINVHHDPAAIDVQWSAVTRLTTHLEKDLEQEKQLLENKKHLVRTAPENVMAASK